MLCIVSTRYTLGYIRKIYINFIIRFCYILTKSPFWTLIIITVSVGPGNQKNYNFCGIDYEQSYLHVDIYNIYNIYNLRLILNRNLLTLR